VSRDRTRPTYVCEECGAQSPRWEGRCPQCAKWNTLVNQPQSIRSERAGWVGTTPSHPQELSQIVSDKAQRIATGSAELNLVLGGGLVPGSLVLFAGDPGIGKSTLLLQTSAQLGIGDKRVLYVSGEESAQQVKLRAERLGITGKGVLFLAETETEEILSRLDELNPSMAVVDSVQTLFTQGATSSPGTVAQVRECTRRLMQWAKEHETPVLLAGHVTKDGTVAGPRVLEHMVDVVLYLEGDTFGVHRILRAVKNRFGSTNEVGLFAMGERGMSDVEDPSGLFLSYRGEAMPGSTVIATLEGTRPLLAEMQALLSPTVFPQPRRTASGVDFQRLILVAAVMGKQPGFSLAAQDIIVNITGGLRIVEPAADLGMAVAMASSFRNAPCQPRTVVIGEVGLGGEVRPVFGLERRLNEAVKLGFKQAIIPEAQARDAEGPAILCLPVSTVRQAVTKALISGHKQDQQKRNTPLLEKEAV
jgi:DNA repair protein RadA/Sms